MRKIFTLCFLIMANIVVAQTVVPNANATAAGGSTFLGPLANSARTYQFLIHSDQLTALVGQNLTGIALRIPASASAAWPSAVATYTSYDIYLSESVAPASRSLTFASNVVGTQTKVRDGALNIAAGAYTTGKTPNDFGPTINFNTPYLYNGGHLLIEIRHTGSGATSQSTDALGTSATGYGTQFSSCWTGSSTGTAGSQGNFTVVSIQSTTSLPVKLGAFTATLENKNNIRLQWQTITEINTHQFEVERSTNLLFFESIAMQKAAGNSSAIKNYVYVDTDVPFSPVVYYRIKFLDKDGKSGYSSVVAVNRKKTNDGIAVYPNPAFASANIAIDVQEKQMATYTIVGVNGKIIRTANIALEKGNNVVAIDVSSLAVGTYIVTVTDKTNSRYVKLVKQ